MKYIINAMHRVTDALVVTNVTYIKFDFVIVFRETTLQTVAHIVLFFLVSR